MISVYVNKNVRVLFLCGQYLIIGLGDICEQCKVKVPNTYHIILTYKTVLIKNCSAKPH